MAGTIRDMGDGRFYLQVSDGFDIRGKRNRHSKMVYASGIREAEKMLAEFVAEVSKGMVAPTNNLTLGEYLIKWLAYKKDKVRPATYAGYKNLSKRTIECMGHILMRRLKPNHIDQFYDILKDPDTRIILPGRSEERKPLSNETVLHYHRFLKTALNDAVGWRIISKNPVLDASPPRSDTQEAKIFSEEQCIQMVSALLNEPIKWQAAAFLAIGGGLRTSELFGLEWIDIDFDTGLVTVRQASSYVQGFGLVAGDPKSKKSIRAFTLPKIPLMILLEHKIIEDRRRESAKIEGREWHDSNRLFVQHNGKPAHPSGYGQWWRKFLVRNKLPHVTPHGLRHTSATLILSSLDDAPEIDINTLSRRLGHSDIRVTMRYLHMLRSTDAAAAEKLNGIFKRGASSRKASSFLDE